MFGKPYGKELTTPIDSANFYKDILHEFPFDVDLPLDMSGDLDLWIEEQRKIDLVFSHYEIDRFGTVDGRGPWEQLALALIWDHVPGVRTLEEVSGPGRPKSWSCPKAMELFYDVEKLKAKGQSTRNACRILAKDPRCREKYLDSKGNPLSGESLRRRYLEFAPVVGQVAHLGLRPEDYERRAQERKTWEEMI